MSGAHALLAPSSAARTIQCSGSVRLQQIYPDLGDDTAAREGTAAHWVMDQMLAGVIVEAGSIAENGVRVETSMIDGAELLRNDIVKTLGDGWQSRIHVEELQPSDPKLHPDNWGTPDVWAVVGTTLHLWDYKYGFGYVEVYENWQLINYFALIAARFNIERVRFVIAQPRSYGPQGPLRTWEVRADMLRAHVNVLGNAYREATWSNPRLRVGPECDNCSARHACPELQRVGLQAADYSKHSQPFDLSPKALGLELQVLDNAIDLLEARRSGLQEQAMRMIIGGSQVPGYGIGYGSGRRAWKQPAAAVINTGKLLGLDLAKPPEAITPTQAVSRGFPEAMLPSMTTVPRGEAKLVREDTSLAAKVFGRSS